MARATGNVDVSVRRRIRSPGVRQRVATRYVQGRLARLASGEHVSYSNVLYALQDLDRRTPEDRTGWALRRDGMPDHEPLILDARCCPWNGPMRRTNCGARSSAGHRTGGRDPGLGQAAPSDDVPDSVHACTGRGFASSSRRSHGGSSPRIGLERVAGVFGHSRARDTPAPSRRCSGHRGPRFRRRHRPPAACLRRGRRAELLPDAPAADEHGHGTLVSGIALYDDVADSLRRGRFVPELRLFSGRILNERNQATAI